jgi:hypothetical protein
MGRRNYRCSARCHHEGCKETTYWNCDSREHYLRVEARYARNWMCIRHSTPSEVLSAENPRIVHEIASDKRDFGVFWGGSGFMHGPGFKAFCSGFPPGTILRVTAEVIPPEEKPF